MTPTKKKKDEEREESRNWKSLKVEINQYLCGRERQKKGTVSGGWSWLNRNKLGEGVMDPLRVKGKIGTLRFVISSKIEILNTVLIATCWNILLAANKNYKLLKCKLVLLISLQPF